MKDFYLSTLLFSQTLALLETGVKFTNIQHAEIVNLADRLFASLPSVENITIAGLFTCLLAYLMTGSSTKLKLAATNLLHLTHLPLASSRSFSRTLFALNPSIPEEISKDIQENTTIPTEMPSWRLAPNTTLKEHEVVSSNDSYSILLVMSDKAFSSNLKKSFSQGFTVILVEDPREIITSSLRHRPDAIIIDENVNGVCGDELCSLFKTNEEIKSIPVVLLTRTDDDESYYSHEKSGADLLELYTTPIPKFRTDMRMLINRQRKLHESTQTSLPNTITITITIPLPEPKQKVVDNLKFLNEIHEKLKENLSTQGYGVHELANDMHACRSKLYKKIRAITGDNPHTYIITFKLKVVARLLSTTDHSIEDITIETGFCDSKHLCKTFKKYYGVTPTIYKERNS